MFHDKANVFLLGENVLYDYQSVFRASHSTNFCLSFFTDKVFKGFNKSLLTRIVLIDLQKYFDVIGHEILLRKCFCLKLVKIHYISEEECRLIDCLPTIKTNDQCINTITYDFVKNTCPYYLNEILEFLPHCRKVTGNNFSKLNKDQIMFCN